MLPTDILCNIYLYLTIGEAINVLKVNSRFNVINDFIWKKKIMIQYGLDKMYSFSWKETAKLLTEVNMINMKKKWIDGRTYEEIFRESLNHKNYFDNLRTKHNIPFEHTGDDYIIDRYYLLKELYTSISHTSDAIRREFVSMIYDGYSEGRINYYFKAVTREFTIISQAHSYIKSTKGISTLVTEYDDPTGSPEIKRLIDPMIIIMRFSHITIDDCLSMWRCQKFYDNLPNDVPRDMIDMDSMWIDDYSYNDLLKIGIDCGSQCFMNIHCWANSFYYGVDADSTCGLESLEKYVYHLYRDEYKVRKDSHNIIKKKIKNIITHEFKVIYLAVVNIEGNQHHIFHNFNFFNEHLESAEILVNNKISSIIDPICYVMSYASMDESYIDKLFTEIIIRYVNHSYKDCFDQCEKGDIDDHCYSHCSKRNYQCLD